MSKSNTNLDILESKKVFDKQRNFQECGTLQNAILASRREFVESFVSDRDFCLKVDDFKVIAGYTYF